MQHFYLTDILRRLWRVFIQCMCNARNLPNPDSVPRLCMRFAPSPTHAYA